MKLIKNLRCINKYLYHELARSFSSQKRLGNQENCNLTLTFELLTEQVNKTISSTLLQTLKRAFTFFVACTWLRPSKHTIFIRLLSNWSHVQYLNVGEFVTDVIDQKLYPIYISFKYSVGSVHFSRWCCSLRLTRLL